MKVSITIIFRICFVLFYNLLSGMTFASANNFISFSLGPAWYHAGHSQTIWLQPNYANTYAASTPIQTLMSGELFLGQQQAFNQAAIQYGLAVVGNTSAYLHGEIWETVDPLFNNFTYQYHVANISILAKTKWLFQGLSTSLFPYLSLGLGVAMNRSYGFSMTPVIFEAVSSPDFLNQRETALTYTLGIGIHKILNPHWQFGIGYERHDWGQSALGATSTQTMGSGISLPHLVTQQLQFTLNYSL
jgi:hypothetical protein